MTDLRRDLWTLRLESFESNEAYLEMSRVYLWAVGWWLNELVDWDHYRFLKKFCMELE